MGNGPDLLRVIKQFVLLSGYWLSNAGHPLSPLYPV